ncbi:MAG: hypothetical protein HXY43_21365 [Fischerella sp.]|uniref:hypothetical protein n=1 Tax=Fischerella sp. TaxID=1191 RepID=UPI0017E734AF|nr:hypothetical protein [Fischerella sp.]NWF61732.1 hypothetical protein [Fischerella sp.]
MQDFNFILNHCDRTIELYEKVEKELIDKNLSPNSAKWVQEELQRIKCLIQGYQEAEAKEMANYFNQ